MQIIGCGHYLPKHTLSNDDLSKTLDTSDEWIYTRTGIKNRHISSFEETVDFMGIEAAKSALESATINSEDIDFIIVSTTTYDKKFPSCAAYIQKAIGAKNSFAFDIKEACAGFVYGLYLAQFLLKEHKIGLVIGSETMSQILNWGDRSTCVLFGDGAGSIVVQQSKNNFLGGTIKTDGNFVDILEATEDIKMNGQAVFKLGIEKMISSMEKTLQQANLTIDDIDYIIPHQANARMIEVIRKHFQCSPEKIVLTVEKYANTSSASIPIALSTVWHKIQSKNRILFTAAGAGFSWGSMLIEK